MTHVAKTDVWVPEQVLGASHRRTYGYRPPSESRKSVALERDVDWLVLRAVLPIDAACVGVVRVWR